MSYSELLKYYKDCIGIFDTIHFNSSVTEGVYNEYLDIENHSEIIPITHSGVVDNRVVREFDSETLNFVFIGSTSVYKGFPLLESVLKDLYFEGARNWRLDVWGAVGESACELINYCGSFGSEQLSMVFDEASLLIVPSVWSETFGFTVLEAISYGVPAIVSSTVGAKDVVSKYDPWFIFETREDLKSKLREIMCRRTKLRHFNKAIVKRSWDYSIESHAEEIFKLYNR